MVSRVPLNDDVMEVLAVLQQRAAARQVPLAIYLRDLAKRDVNLPCDAPPIDAIERTLDEQAADRDFDADFDELAGDYPVLPPDFSRKDIYGDHD